MRLGLTLLAVTGLLAAAAPAQAATVGRQDGQTVYTAGPGEENAVTVEDRGTPGSELVFTDAPGVTIAPVAPCYRPGAEANVAVCPPGYSIDVLLGDLDDTANASDMAYGYPLFSGGDGADVLTGPTGPASVAMHGGAGRDEYVNGVGFDHVAYPEKTGGVTASLDGVANDPDGENVPPAIDSLGGSGGDDTLSGSPERDYVSGGPGEDVVLGLGGNDEISGDDGDDRLDAGDGNDLFSGDDRGADDVSGGAGFDRFELAVNPLNFAEFPASRPADLTVTLDDQANDGRFGEGDNIRSDIEDVGPDFYASFDLRFALTGDGDFNVLSGGRRTDRLEGGDGSDRLVAREGDDTILARDGVMDRVECGPGADTAFVDPADELAECETVDAGTGAQAASAGDDRPPTVAFTTPGDGARLGARTTVRLDARDDRGVSRVLLFDDERVVATDATAPYELAYAPGGDDVGRNTLVAVAVDAAEQTGTAVRPVRVTRFRPGVRGAAVPSRDRRAPFRFAVAGSVTLPRAVTRAQGCRGRVMVQVKRDRRTISTRRAKVDRRCAFRSAVTFRDRRRLGAGHLEATVRFLGNAVLRPRTARPLDLRAG